MGANLSAVDLVLDIIRRQLGRPELSLAEAMTDPHAKLLLDIAAERTEAPGPAGIENREPEDHGEAAAKFVASLVALRAAIEDTFEITEISPTEPERAALLAASDIVMIDGKRRLRLGDAVRAEILDAAIGSER